MFLQEEAAVKRFVKVCVGSTALALGIAVVPMAADAAGGAHGNFQPFHPGKAPVAHRVNFLAVSREAPKSHPDLAAPILEANPQAVAAQRAAAVRSGGLRGGVVALAPSASSLAAATTTALADFPTMSMSQQITDFGSGQALEPPDTQIAAGPTAVVEATNDTLSIWSKSGTLLGADDLNTFLSVPTGTSPQSFTDPQLLYDAGSGRWFLTGWSFDSTFTNTQFYIAVSATSDPTGTWNVYPFTNSASELTDQPMLGVCNDKVVVAWNDFTHSTTGDTYNGAILLAFTKADLVAGSSTLSLGGFADPDEFRLVPARSQSPSNTCFATVNDSADLLPAGSAAPANTIGVISVTGLPTTTSNGTLSATEFNPSITGTQPPAAPAQPGGTLNNTSNDDRFVSAVWQNNQLWTSATVACTPTGDTVTRNCMRLIEVSTAGSSPSVIHNETLGTNGLDEYYPAVSVADTGDLFVSYTASSSTEDPTALATISQSGTSFTAPFTIEAGAAAYGGTRWGDYSAAAPDPLVPGAVWVAAEYAPADAATPDWATGVAELTLSSAQSVAVSALATNGVPYAQAPQLGAGWHSLGGTVIAVPAVAAQPNPDGTTPSKPLFVAPGSNHLLYIRGVTGAWVRLGPNNISCLSAAAAITNNVLQLACETTTHGLSYNTAKIPATGLPQFTSVWKSLGGTGTIAAGPALARVGGALTFFVLATDGKVHTRTTSTGYTSGLFSCLGQPAAATVPGTGVTYFACQGSNHGVFVSTNGGAGWGPLVQLSGTLAAGPGIAPTSRVPVLLLEGSNKAVYEGTPGGSFARLGTILVNGVEAAALN